MKPKELKDWMKFNGVTSLTEIAAMAGVTEKTIRRFLSGETKPSPLLLDALHEKVLKSNIRASGAI